MTTVNLDLTAYRTMTAAQQSAFAQQFGHELGPLLADSQLGTALTAIYAAVAAASANSNAIDLTVLGGQLDRLSRLLIVLKGIDGPAGPTGQPPVFLQAFVASVRSTFTGVDTYLSAAGKRDFH